MMAFWTVHSRVLLLATIVAALGTAGPGAAQSPIEAAREQLRRGRHWQATQILMPMVSDSASRSPEVALLAAEAAAGWGGWRTVGSLLERATWLEREQDRLGLRLLSQSALARGEAGNALRYARASMGGDGSARASRERGLRWLLVARALDRLNQRDSAFVAYRTAAAHLPTVRDWLYLRAAGVARNDSTRQQLYRLIVLASARSRIAPTEAIALERSGDFHRAEVAYAKGGDRRGYFRMRWALARDSVAKGRVREELLAAAADSSRWEASRDAIDMVALLRVPLGRDDQRLVARRAMAVERFSDAARRFALLDSSVSLSDADRLLWASALGELGRWNEAATQATRVPSRIGSQRARMYRLRGLLRSGVPDVTVELQRFIGDSAADAETASLALFALADVLMDRGQSDSARTTLRAMVSRYPRSSLASRATLLAAILAWDHGDLTAVERELRAALFGRLALPDSGGAMRYWFARALEVNSRKQEADSQFRVVITNGPQSYYGLKAAERLGATLAPVMKRNTTPTLPAIATGLRRARLLDSLGLDAEEGFELDALEQRVVLPSDRLELAEAMVGAGYVVRAHGTLARGGGAADRSSRTLRIAYPLAYQPLVEDAARDANIDPHLVRAVMRQESKFNPRSRSLANALGLMQVLPVVTKERMPRGQVLVSDSAMFMAPELNIAVGARQLSLLLGKHQLLEPAIAAYNAGSTRVERWYRTLERNGLAPSPTQQALDVAEYFVERIPFAETREYVKLVMRNLMIYRALEDDR